MIPRLDAGVQDLLRALAPKVLGVLLRRHRDFGHCEDAVQEALITAATRWPTEGVPAYPQAWLIAVASRRVTDQVRAETARRLRERLVVSLVPPEDQIAAAADAGANERDDTLDLYFMCCHPVLSAASQVALTLRAVGGLSTSEIARAFLVPESTMAQRLSRAKQTIKSHGASFGDLTSDDRAARLPTVLKILYLVFSEGYTATSGAQLQRVDLSTEAIRVTRLLGSLLPSEPEVEGLLALMLLTDARRTARTGPSGELIPLDQQERSRWNQTLIAEGERLLEHALSRGTPGPYQVQAAIAALHDRAANHNATDWVQIRRLYELLLRINDSPMARLSHAIAIAMIEGPIAGLNAIDELSVDPRISTHHRLDAVRAHLLQRAGRLKEAVRYFHQAAERTASTPERTYLLLHAARLNESVSNADSPHS